MSEFFAEGGVVEATAIAKFHTGYIICKTSLFFSKTLKIGHISTMYATKHKNESLSITEKVYVLRIDVRTSVLLHWAAFSPSGEADFGVFLSIKGPMYLLL